MPTHLELLRGRCYTLEGAYMGMYMGETMVALADGCNIVALKFRKEGADITFDDFDCDSEFVEVPCTTRTASGSSSSSSSSSSAARTSSSGVRSPSEERFDANTRRAIEASMRASVSVPARVPERAPERVPASVPVRAPVRAPVTTPARSIPAPPVSGFKRSQPSSERSATNRIEDSRKRTKPTITKPNVDMECPVCFESFADVEPVTIKCGHTLCRVCLEGSLARKDECPICKTTGIAPASQYKANPFIREVAKFFKQTRGGSRNRRSSRQSKRNRRH